MACTAKASTLRLQNSQYVSSNTAYFRSGASTENASISLFLNEDYKFNGRYDARMDLKNEYSSTENWNYLHVHQAYVRYKLDRDALHLGRKQEQWSSWDQDWRLGVFEPRYMQNRLRPEGAGLVGFYYNGRSGQRTWTIAALPVHIPETGAHFWIQDGQFVSRNPWFNPPASRYNFRGEPGDIRYRVNTPDFEELALRPGVAVKWEHLDDSGFRFAGAYKPVPQLMLGFPSLGKYVLSDTENYLSVEVTAKVAYHALVSGEGWVKSGPWTVNFGLARDEVLESHVPADWTAQTFTPAWIWSASLSRPLEAEGPSARRLRFSILKVTGGDGDDRGVFASDRRLFERRFQYLEAYSAALIFPVRGLAPAGLRLETRATYDRLQNGGSFLVAAGYGFSRDWRIDAEVEFLGLLGESAIVDDGFFSTYRANDRVSLGMSYVF